MITKVSLKPGNVLSLNDNTIENAYIVLKCNGDTVTLLNKATAKTIVVDYNSIEEVACEIINPDNFIKELSVKSVMEILPITGMLVLSVDAWDKVFIDAYTDYKKDNRVFTRPISERKWVLIISENDIDSRLVKWSETLE